ncbi:nuclear transport factor 2 family protein [Xenorhabdus bovienii]|uniref:nuclear transport factor 2 family protein n=1 Tax=Xenorhabdus bovienii TaxID=40576 RepID=UPI003DA5830C
MLNVLFDKYIEAVIEKSPSKLASLFCDDGILKLPFRTGRPIIEGNSNILEHYLASFGQAPLVFISIEDVEIYDTADCDTFIVEYRLNGETLPEKRGFYCLYINVFKVKNGKVKELHDYEDVLNRELILLNN